MKNNEVTLVKINTTTPEYREDLAMRQFMKAVHKKDISSNNLNKFINIYDAYRIVNYFMEVEREKKQMPYAEIEIADFEEIEKPDVAPKRGRPIGSMSKILTENKEDVLNYYQNLGFNFSQIGKIYGVTRQTVKAFLIAEDALTQKNKWAFSLTYAVYLFSFC